MKGERKCQNEKEENEEELGKSEEYLGDHHHVNAQGGETSQVEK